ncbi:hypothetical protein PGB90_005695 [Kerria lacca]
MPMTKAAVYGTKRSKSVEAVKAVIVLFLSLNFRAVRFPTYYSIFLAKSLSILKCSVGPNNNNGSNTNKSNNVCFTTTSRPSNESQCPMLQPTKTTQNAKIKSKIKGKKTLTNRIGARNSAVGMNSTGSSASHTKKLRFQLAKERKASTTLGIIMSAFIICWLPFFVLALVRPFLHDSKAIPNSLSSIFLWLGYANSLLNPIIYATLNRDFRRPFQQILFFRCGSLNHMMREEFYHSQYGDPDPPQHFYMTGSSPEKTTAQNFKEADDDIEIINSSSSVKSPIQTSKSNESFL